MANLSRRDFLSMSGVAAAAATTGCTTHTGETTQAQEAKAQQPPAAKLRIIATSDIHGKLLPWDYVKDEADSSGSLAQLATAIAELRDENTILVDAGDTIQDNMAEFFLTDTPHPMLACMGTMGYDIGVCGNHEFDFGIDVTRRYIADFPGKSLLGNVYDETGELLADAYTIIERAGVSVGIIGMVTPGITLWNARSLEGYQVTNPVDEVRRIIDEIKDDCDVLIAVCHMGLTARYNLPGTGTNEIAAACPELDLIISAHSHTLVEGDRTSGVLTVQNKNGGKTFCCADLTLSQESGRWQVTEATSFARELEAYEPDASMSEMAAPYNERVLSYAHEVVGRLEGGNLVPQGNSPVNPLLLSEDTPLVDLIQRVMLHYSEADVALAGAPNTHSDVPEGDLSRADVAKIYPFSNDLCVLRMTGGQLRHYLENTARLFCTWEPDVVTYAFDQKIPYYDYDLAQGVSYSVDVSREPGSRIQELSWPDGRAVADDDVLRVAVTNYRYDSQISVPGTIFEAADLPELIDAGVHSEIGTIREMVADYIQYEQAGVIRPECDGNYRVVGADWDPKLHERAIELAEAGVIDVFGDSPYKNLPTRAVTTSELEALLEDTDVA